LLTKSTGALIDLSNVTDAEFMGKVKVADGEPLAVVNDELTFNVDDASFLDKANQHLGIDEDKFITAVYGTFADTQGDGIAIGQAQANNKTIISLHTADNSALEFDGGELFVDTDGTTIQTTTNKLNVRISQAANNKISKNNDGLYADGMSADGLNVILGARQAVT
jgi:hypothetical protein